VVDQRQSRPQQRLRGRLVLGVKGGAKLPDLMAEPRRVHAVERRALSGLPDSLEGGLVTCHKLSFSKNYRNSI
jgi:hypothetical protein